MNYKITEYLNITLKFIVDNLYPYAFSIHNQAMLIGLVLLFSVMYIISNKAYKFTKSNPLPWKISLTIRTIYFSRYLVLLYYFYVLIVNLLIISLAYLTDTIQNFSWEYFVPSIVIYCSLYLPSLVLESSFLSRPIQQQIINPLNQISNNFNSIKSGKKRVQPWCEKSAFRRV
jgi:hypothetical protein